MIDTSSGTGQIFTRLSIFAFHVTGSRAASAGAHRRAKITIMIVNRMATRIPGPIPAMSWGPTGTSAIPA